METIEKLSSSLDFTDYASQIIHALIQVQLPHNAITTFIVHVSYSFYCVPIIT